MSLRSGTTLTSLESNVESDFPSLSELSRQKDEERLRHQETRNIEKRRLLPRHHSADLLASDLLLVEVPNPLPNGVPVRQAQLTSNQEGR